MSHHSTPTYAVASRVPPNDANAVRSPRVNRTILILLPLLLAFVGLVIGTGAGVVQFFSSKQGFESQAAIQILSDSEDGSDFPHNVIIGGKFLIEQCLARDGGNLKKLRIFDTIPKDDIAEFVQDNLIVESPSEDNRMLQLRFISADESDSPTVLNNLISTYEESLIRKAMDSKDLASQRLRESIFEHKISIEVVEKEIQRLRNKLTALTEHSILALDIAKRSIARREILAEKISLSRLVQEAIEGEEDSHAEVVWQLKAKGYSSEGIAGEELDALELLTRYKKLFDQEVASIGEQLVDEDERFHLHSKEGRKQTEIKRKVDELVAELRPMQRQMLELKSKSMSIDTSRNSVRPLERIENGTIGKFRFRATTGDIGYAALIGMLIGMATGTTYAFILK